MPTGGRAPSRPIKVVEHQLCAGNGVRYTAFTIANDGLTVIVNRQNTWATCLTVEELRRIWDAGSKVDNWRDVRAGFPNVPLELYGPGTDSGTFDFFTEKVNGRSRRSRPDYQASEDDNVIVRGVSGERGGLGYFGLSDFEENRSRLRAVRIDNGKGCVAPSVKTVHMFNNEGAVARKARYVPLTKKQLEKARLQYRQTLRAVFK
jgi:phosphate transport system substrate-binding protein